MKNIPCTFAFNDSASTRTEHYLIINFTRTYKIIYDNISLKICGPL